MGDPSQTSSFFGKAQHDAVYTVHNLAQMKKLIKDTPGVIIDFWRRNPPSGPCEHFKPKFASACSANQNKKLVFCTVDVSSVPRDLLEDFNIQSIPHLFFFLNGEKVSDYVGVDERKFSENLGKLHAGTGPKSGKHMQMTFKLFAPLSLKPTTFSATNNVP